MVELVPLTRDNQNPTTAFCFLQQDELQMLHEVEYGVAGDWSELYWPPGGNEVMALHPPTYEQAYPGHPEKYTFIRGDMGTVNEVLVCVIQ